MFHDKIVQKIPFIVRAQGTRENLKGEVGKTLIVQIAPVTLTRNKETKESYITTTRLDFHRSRDWRGGARGPQITVGIRRENFPKKSLNLIKWRCGLSVRDVNAQEKRRFHSGVRAVRRVRRVESRRRYNLMEELSITAWHIMAPNANQYGVVCGVPFFLIEYARTPFSGPNKQKHLIVTNNTNLVNFLTLLSSRVYSYLSLFKSAYRIIREYKRDITFLLASVFGSVLLFRY